jgi:hypothetical protein
MAGRRNFLAEKEGHMMTPAQQAEQEQERMAQLLLQWRADRVALVMAVDAAQAQATQRAAGAAAPRAAAVAACHQLRADLAMMDQVIRRYTAQWRVAQRATLVAQLAEREAQRALVLGTLAERQQTVALQAARVSSPDHATAFAADPTTSQLRMRARLLEHSSSYLAGCIEDIDGGHR